MANNRNHANVMPMETSANLDVKGSTTFTSTITGGSRSEDDGDKKRWRGTRVGLVTGARSSGEGGGEVWPTNNFKPVNHRRIC